VLDEVMRSFDDDAATEVSASEPAATLVNLRADPDRPDPGGDSDDPLEWSLLDLGADPSEIAAAEMPRAADSVRAGGSSDDDSMANLAFSNETALSDDDSQELALGDEDLAELVLEEPAEMQAAGRADKTGRSRSKGPQIDLPEDDDLDSLFDDIQIDS
jgi:hypothetical protein